MGAIRLGDLVGIPDGTLGYIVGRTDGRWMVDMEDGRIVLTDVVWKAGTA